MSSWSLFQVETETIVLIKKYIYTYMDKSWKVENKMGTLRKKRLS